MWGWLEPGSPSLPHIQLQGNAVALGRGTGRQSIDTKSEEIAKAHPAPEPSSPVSCASPSVAASPRQVPEALLSSGCLCQRECAVRHCLFCSCAVAVQTPPELLLLGMQRPGNRLGIAAKITRYSALVNKPDIACRAVWSKDLNFVEIQDGRVSRLHCIIRPSKTASPGSSKSASTGGQCVMPPLSRNSVHVSSSLCS